MKQGHRKVWNPNRSALRSVSTHSGVQTQESKLVDLLFVGTSGEPDLARVVDVHQLVLDRMKEPFWELLNAGLEWNGCQWLANGTVSGPRNYGGSGGRLTK